MSDGRDVMTVGVRRAARLTGLGLLVQLIAALHWTPATFIAAATLGAPLVLSGAGLFLAAVWRNMKAKGAV
jgi:hypothetical protein